MSVKRCPQCNLVNWATDVFCKRCGSDLQVVDVLQSAKAEMSETGFEKKPAHNHFQSQPLSPETHQFSGEFGEQQPSSTFNNNNFQPENKQINSPKPINRYSGYQNSSNYQPNNSSAKKGMAIASLVFGILGFPFVSMFLGGIVSVILAMIFGTVGAIAGISIFLLMIPLGLILGIVAVYRANKKPNVYGGKGFAIAGIVCSACGILILPIVAAIAIPNILAARKAANEGSAIAGLRTISSAEGTYMSTRGRCADLQTLGAENMIDSVLANGQRSGYRFTVVKLPTTRGDCAVTATPSSTSEGTRAFYYSTEDSLIRARKFDGKPAEPNDEPIE